MSTFKFSLSDILFLIGFVSIVLAMYAAAISNSRFSGMYDSDAVHLSYSPSGRTLAIEHRNGELALWDVKPRKRVSVGHTDGYRFCHLLDDQTSVVCRLNTESFYTSHFLQSVELWNLATREVSVVAEADDSTSLGDRSFIRTSGDGRRLAIRAHNHLKIYDLDKENCVLDVDLDGHGHCDRRTHAVALNQDGTTMWASYGKSIHEWDVGAVSLRQKLSRPRLDLHERYLMHPDQNLLVIRQEDKGDDSEQVTGDTYDVTVVRLPSVAGRDMFAMIEGELTLLALRGDFLQLWDTESGHLKGELAVSNNPRHVFGWLSSDPSEDRCYAVAPDGKTIAVSTGGAVTIYDAVTLEPRFVLWRDRTRWAGIVFRRVSPLVFCVLLIGLSVAWGFATRESALSSSHAENAGSGFARAPVEIAVCWILMPIGGIWSLITVVFILFGSSILHLSGLLQNEQLWYQPLVLLILLYPLALGIITISAGFGRNTKKLKHIAIMQFANLLFCDPVNPVLGIVALANLRTAKAQHFVEQLP